MASLGGTVRRVGTLCSSGSGGGGVRRRRRSRCGVSSDGLNGTRRVAGAEPRTAAGRSSAAAAAEGGQEWQRAAPPRDVRELGDALVGRLSLACHVMCQYAPSLPEYLCAYIPPLPFHLRSISVCPPPPSPYAPLCLKAVFVSGSCRPYSVVAAFTISFSSSCPFYAGFLQGASFSVLFQCTVYH